MSKQSEDNFAVALSSWAAIIILAIIMATFMHCQKSEDRLLECVKLTKDIGQCGKVFAPRPGQR